MKQIVAKDGYYLTQKEVKNEGERVFSIRLMLADEDSEDNWKEVLINEYYEWEKRMDAEFVKKLRGA